MDYRPQELAKTLRNRGSCRPNDAIEPFHPSIPLATSIVGFCSSPKKCLYQANEAPPISSHCVTVLIDLYILGL